MNENEIMVNEEVIEEPEVINEETGMSTGMAMLIGSGLTLAIIAGIKQGKKIMDKIKAKKEQPKEAEDSKVIEITNETVIEDDSE